MIFIDTSFFVALLSPRDAHHKHARQAFDAFKGQRLVDLFLTTNNVVLETITVAGRQGGNRLAVEVGQMLYAEKLARLYRPTPEDERAALADRQMQVTKLSGEDSTRTRIRALNDDERIDELARMLGGVKITKQTRDHAREMMQQTRENQTDLQKKKKTKKELKL